jgi:hypothetical protein
MLRLLLAALYSLSTNILSALVTLAVSVPLVSPNNILPSLVILANSSCSNSL